MKKILLVDDEEEVRELIALKIAETFPQALIIQANNGHDAYKKACNQKFDLIWTDYKMPRMMGTDFAIMMREVQEKKVPLVIYTAFIDEVKAKCKVKDQIQFISKEETLDSVMDIIRPFLRN